MDHISDSFLETNVPLLVLIEAAKSGNEKEVKEYAQVFREHANKLVEVSTGHYQSEQEAGFRKPSSKQFNAGMGFSGAQFCNDKFVSENMENDTRECV
ncbi:hypothetical protein DNTS_030000 [Danionella cerebrum]|uniref:Catenin alpha-2 n=1 Tax=Danionella cerebrum TaxID=2873325 RepID=A0A553QMJ0_9TELE|nr:hypothetical protein DNTS_030000 [Danionella translucida]